MSYHLNKSIIHFMKENEDKIRGGVKASTSTSVNISCVRCCKCFLVVVERVFCEMLAKKEMTAVMASCKAVYKQKQLNCFFH
jgi:hypothetical protein